MNLSHGITISLRCVYSEKSDRFVSPQDLAFTDENLISLDSTELAQNRGQTWTQYV